MMTDEWGGYNGLAPKFNHFIVSHGKGQYVSGDCHTNGMENFWSLLKRGIIGQYHYVSAKHLNSYVNEFCFRYNNRANVNVFDLTILKSVNLG